MVKRDYQKPEMQQGITLTLEPETLQPMAEQGKSSLTPVQTGNVLALLSFLLSMRDETTGKKRYKSLEQLADAIGVSRSALSQQRKGTNRPGVATVNGLHTLLQSFGITVDMILDGTAVGAVRRDSSADESAAVAVVDQKEGSVRPMAEAARVKDSSKARYPTLEHCLLFYVHHTGRWSPLVVTAARSGHFATFGCDAWNSQQWEEALDWLEGIYRQLLSQNPPPGDPGRAKKISKRT